MFEIVMFYFSWDMRCKRDIFWVGGKKWKFESEYYWYFLWFCVVFGKENNNNKNEIGWKI